MNRPEDRCECGHRRDEHMGKLCVGVAHAATFLVFVPPGRSKGCLCRGFEPYVFNERNRICGPIGTGWR